MTPAQRLKSWLAAHAGQARIVLGTRMAIFASLPHLALIVVDEEHDASYKQQEGARYSARDLALWRGRDCGAKVILGSATPSLESWHASDPAVGRYQRLTMPSRIGLAELPRLRLIDMAQQPRKAVFAPPSSPPSPSGWNAASSAWCCSTAAVSPPCCTAAPVAGRATAPTARPPRYFTRWTARCAATTAAPPSAYRVPARPAATPTSTR